MHLQEKPLLVLRRRFVITTIICNNVSQRKDAGSQIQVREDAQSVRFLQQDIGLADQLLLFFMDQQVSSTSKPASVRRVEIAVGVWTGI